MNKKSLGGSSLQVTELCLGTMYFGTKVNPAVSFDLLNHYHEAGGNFIDTSNNYAFWMGAGTGDESEKVVGRWLKETGLRNQIVLATKVGARPIYPGAGMDKLEGLSYQTIIEAVEGSLKRLGTDRIDLYYAHVDWDEYPLEGRMKAFDKLITEGKILEIGASNLYPWRYERSQNLAENEAWAQYCCVQLKHSYLRPKPDADFWVQKLISDEWLDYSRNNENASLIGYSPLLSGAYTTGEIPEEYQTSDNDERMRVLTELASDYAVTRNQMVLQWMMHSSNGIIPLIAASKIAQLQENLAVAGTHIGDEIIQELNKAG